MKIGWAQLAWMAASALLALLCVDYLMHSVAPPKRWREVEHGVQDLRRSDPSVLVLGSSHARSFYAVGHELARRTAGAQSLVSVPVEWGKLYAYDWVLHERLAPILDERGSSGKPLRGRVRQFFLVTEWWDSCRQDHAYRSLPGRAWELEDFVEDVRRDGINGYNRNYLQNRFRVQLEDSALAHDRTQQVLAPKLVRLVRGKPLNPTPEEEQRFVAQWQDMVEKGMDCIGDPAQMKSLDSVLRFAQKRKWETTIVLFPRKPATLTAKAKTTTLAAYADLVRKAAAPYGARVIDLSYRTPLEDSDFMEDFDHVTESGNRKFARWVLDQDLKFLAAPAGDNAHGSKGH